MTTAFDIIERALYPMRDTSQVLFVDGELLTYMNDAMNDLCARERILLKTADLTTTGGALSFGADLIALRWVKDEDGNEIEWSNPTQFFEEVRADALSGDGDDDAIGAVYNQKVYLHPAPVDGTTFEVGYIATATQLTTNGDTFPLPLMWEKKVGHYVRAQAYRRLGEIALSDREMADYEAGLRPSSSSADRTTPGRIDMAQALGPFDLDPDAIHRGM